jgi:hypothetical protein
VPQFTAVGDQSQSRDLIAMKVQVGKDGGDVAKLVVGVAPTRN